jgi:hypothetical protein
MRVMRMPVRLKQDVHIVQESGFHRQKDNHIISFGARCEKSNS